MAREGYLAPRKGVGTGLNPNRAETGALRVGSATVLCSRRRWTLWASPSPRRATRRAERFRSPTSFSGTGPFDLVIFLGPITNVELMWEDADYRVHFERLGSFARLIRFDKRGTGLSDRMAGIADMGEGFARSPPCIEL
jgi:hypothetical protein